MKSKGKGETREKEYDFGCERKSYSCQNENL